MDSPGRTGDERSSGSLADMTDRATTDAKVQEEVDVPPAPFALSEAEWLVVLPAGVPWVPQLPNEPPVEDPAAAARREHPLVLDDFIDALRTRSVFLASTVRPQIVMEPWTRRLLLRHAQLWVACAFVQPIPWLLADGAFGTTQLAVGTATSMAFYTCTTIGTALLASYRNIFGAVHPLGVGKQSKTAVRPARDFSSHGLAGLARWIQLSSGSLPAPAEPVILAHDPADPFCPCSAPQCCGNLPRLVALSRIAEVLVRVALSVALTLAAIWTVAISPSLAPRTWTTAWSTSAVTFLLASFAAFFAPVIINKFSAPNLPLLRLKRRINRRAMRLALGALMDRYRMAAASQGQRGPEPPRAAHAGYMQLHDVLACSWSKAVGQYNSSAALFLPASAAVVFGLANVVGCSCLRAQYPIYLLYVTASNFLFDLVNVAAANAQISDIRDLYLSAGRSLRELRRRLVAGPGDPDLRLLMEMDADADLLASYADTDRYRAKLLGFPVDYGILRTLAVTLVTLTVAVWSMLRGLGVFLTMETVCPTR
ncbi:hypothetical protein DFJ74DRAFT_684002 [Hyaloraphidium curvatum]|nr:hypothetical protein DFJ74DRAFT_684002 [Hyaloraphidium curvatum]